MDVRHYCIYVSDRLSPPETDGHLEAGRRRFDTFEADNPDRVLGSLSLEGPTRVGTEGVAARVRDPQRRGE